MKDVEVLDQQQHQLNELMHVLQAQQAQLRQLVPHAVNSDHSSDGSSALMASASLGQFFMNCKNVLPVLKT